MQNTSSKNILSPHGFDFADATMRLQGNRSLLESLIKKFSEKEVNAGTRIDQLIDEGEFDQARRLAHQLKGTAANLGATALSASAKEVEFSLKESRAVSRASIHNLTNELQHLKDVATHLELIKHLQKLNDVVRFDLAQAFVVMEEIKAFTSNQEQQNTVKKLENLLESLDTDALETELELFVQQLPLLGNKH